jgi:hypothetical protein
VVVGAVVMAGVAAVAVGVAAEEEAAAPRVAAVKAVDPRVAQAQVPALLMAEVGAGAAEATPNRRQAPRRKVGLWT